MKKFLFAMMLCVATLCSVRAGDFSDINWGEKIAFYLPNRILDALDFVSVNLGVGPTVEARLMFTRYCDVGAGWSAGNAKAFKDYNRQYGGGIEEGWYWSFIFVSEEQYTLTDSLGTVKRYSEDRTGIPKPDTRTYDFFTGQRDFWAIGGSLGLLVDGSVYIHPTEWVDLGLGFFLIDFRNDDYILDDFR